MEHFSEVYTNEILKAAKSIKNNAASKILNGEICLISRNYFTRMQRNYTFKHNSVFYNMICFSDKQAIKKLGKLIK